MIYFINKFSIYVTIIVEVNKAINVAVSFIINTANSIWINFTICVSPSKYKTFFVYF